MTAAAARRRRRHAGKHGKKKLTPHQRRIRAIDKDPLYDPRQVLSGHNLRHAAKAIVHAELAPKLSALDREAATAERQGGALSGRVDDYYRQLATEEQGNVTRQQALSQQLRTRLAGIASESQGVIDKAAVGEQQSVQADEAVRGPGLGGGNADVLAELAAQRARSAQTAQGFRSAGELEGAASESLAGNLKSAAGLRGGEVHTEFANRLASTLGDIRSRRSEVEGLRGEAFTKALTEMRQSGFENLAVAEGLGLKRADLRAQVADQRARRKLTARQLAETGRHNRALENISFGNLTLGQDRLSETQRHNLASEQNAADRNKNSSDLTPTQRRARRRDIERAVGGVKSGTFETKDGRHVPLVELLRRDPGKWRPRIHAQLQAKYGKKVADQAMRRLRSTIRNRGGGLLGIVDTVGGMLDQLGG